ncbi:monofunctional biosynthetic peptidoglycan transglycosylase [Roseovarius phycicola]|uniref:Biosynthetic peptidoglycan transglycosylase n=1 Tax=Roseovarius phycicola TaxID=3080976 RepID=A0ABZ2HJZ5_9RHOB
MAKRKPKPKPSLPARLIDRMLAPVRWIWRWVLRGAIIVTVIVCATVAAHGYLDPPRTLYMAQESSRLSGIDHQWVPIEEMSDAVPRSVVAAEDANFCLHWGFDMKAIRTALEDGARRGASTLSQQVVKNVYLWHGRSWSRKAFEALITPMVETFWSKRRILEVYLNVAEFDDGVFGVEAASRHYFNTGPEDLSEQQAALLAAILPNPKERSAAKPNNFVRKRARQVRDGAATIRRDGRAACFED